MIKKGEREHEHSKANINYIDFGGKQYINEQEYCACVFTSCFHCIGRFRVHFENATSMLCSDCFQHMSKRCLFPSFSLYHCLVSCFFLCVCACLFLSALVEVLFGFTASSTNLTLWFSPWRSNRVYVRHPVYFLCSEPLRARIWKIRVGLITPCPCKTL